MNRSGNLVKMIALMTAYGVILGGIAGFLVGWAILIVDSTTFSESMIRNLINITVLSLMYGGIFGGVYGGGSGLISGFFMAMVTAIAFGEIRNVQRFKMVMGLITGIMTIGVFMLGGLWWFGSGIELTWTLAMILSIVIAVYASQIVSKKYIKQIDLRKKKGIA